MTDLDADTFDSISYDDELDEPTALDLETVSSVDDEQDHFDVAYYGDDDLDDLDDDFDEG